MAGHNTTRPYQALDWTRRRRGSTRPPARGPLRLSFLDQAKTGGTVAAITV